MCTAWEGGVAGSNHAELSRASGSDKYLRTEEWLKYWADNNMIKLCVWCSGSVTQYFARQLIPKAGSLRSIKFPQPHLLPLPHKKRTTCLLWREWERKGTYVFQAMPISLSPKARSGKSLCPEPCRCCKVLRGRLFCTGSMLPKVQAAMKFVRVYPDRKAIITSLDKAIDALEGRTGTVI